MDQLIEKTYTTSRSYTYRYYFHPGSGSAKPALLLCHGWPDDAHLWAGIIPSLLPLGFPLIVPDLLGYDGTSKPTDPAEYNFKGMASDLMEIVDSEKIGSIIPVGHDWGAGLAQRVYPYFPDRCVGMFLLNVAYLPPSEAPFDLAALNAMTKQAFGYPAFAYWDLFAAQDGPEILRAHAESLYAAIHGLPDGWMKDMFCTEGAIREFLLADKTVEVKPYARNPALKKHYVERFQRDGFEAPQCWYKATVQNVQYESDRSIPKEHIVIKVPLLFLGCSGDYVCRTDAIYRTKELIPDLTVKEIDSGHWCTLEKPDEVSEVFVAWLKEKFP